MSKLNELGGAGDGMMQVIAPFGPYTGEDPKDYDKIKRYTCGNDYTI
jgi:hypothetical protein